MMMPDSPIFRRRNSLIARVSPRAERCLSPGPQENADRSSARGEARRVSLNKKSELARFVDELAFLEAEGAPHSVFQAFVVGGYHEGDSEILVQHME